MFVYILKLQFGVFERTLNGRHGPLMDDRGMRANAKVSLVLFIVIKSQCLLSFTVIEFLVRQTQHCHKIDGLEQHGLNRLNVLQNVLILALALPQLLILPHHHRRSTVFAPTVIPIRLTEPLKQQVNGYGSVFGTGSGTGTETETGTCAVEC